MQFSAAPLPAGSRHFCLKPAGRSAFLIYCPERPATPLALWPRLLGRYL